MHGDKKVGLALAILLFGTVGALFFRNEPDPALAPPQLNDPAALDKEIAKKQRNIPYLQDAETAKNSAGQSTKTTKPKQHSQWKMPAFLKENPVDAPLGFRRTPFAEFVPPGFEHGVGNRGRRSGPHIDCRQNLPAAFAGRFPSLPL